jgi:hypothetical protein
MCPNACLSQGFHKPEENLDELRETMEQLFMKAYPSYGE